MSRTSRYVVAVSAVCLAAFLGGCNPLEGGSEPSGSVLHIRDLEWGPLTQDIYFCEGESIEYVRANFTVSNDSRPNFEDSVTTADGTNSRVTLSRYRVDYAVLNMSATVPSLDGAGIGGTIDPDGEADWEGLPMISESQLQYIRVNYPMIGNGQVMDIRADVTIWGKDDFDVDVSTGFSITFAVDDFAPCSDDLPVADDSENELI